MLALLEWVPADGATVASIRGGRHWLGWTRSAELLADTWDLHAAIAHAKGGKKAKHRTAPRYPRPKSPPAVAGQRSRRRLADFPGVIDVRDYQKPGR